MKNFLSLTATGVTSRSNRRYVAFTCHGKTVFILYARCKTRSRDILAALNVAGFHMHGSGALERIDDLLSRVRDFPGEPLIDVRGWSCPYFVFRDGQIIVPKGADKARLVFGRDAPGIGAAGDLDAWLTRVAAPAAKSPILAFVIGLAFAALIRAIAGNDIRLGFEVVGEPGIDTALLQEVAASAAGPIIGAPVPFSALAADPERLCREYADTLMLIEDHEVALASETVSRQVRPSTKLWRH